VKVGFNAQAYIVALLPEHKLDESARELNERLDEHGSEFIFNDKVVPHMSLYMLQIHSQHLDEIVIELSGIAKRYDGIDLSFLGWRIRNRYLAAMFARTREVTRLQREVVDRLNPLRAETHPDSFIGVKSATVIEHRNVEQYGWKSIGDAYDPHMTVARFIEEDSSVSCSDSYGKGFDGSFNRIALFEMGSSGTTSSQVANFALKPLREMPGAVE